MGDERRPQSKVARVIDRHGLDGLGGDLERRWTDDEDRASLRSLARAFNLEVLQAALAEAGRPTSRPEVEHVYDVLTGEDVTGGTRVQKRRELERDGVDVDRIEGEFVTHQAMHTYLREYRGASLDDGEEHTVENARETLERLRSRTVAVTQGTVERLRDTGRVDAGDLAVYVDVRVECPDCGADLDVATFLAEGGCGCADENKR
ncbi:MAG: rod-determining factor RdfA [Halanaeroarchaeum sp.]